LVDSLVLSLNVLDEFVLALLHVEQLAVLLVHLGFHGLLGVVQHFVLFSQGGLEREIVFLQAVEHLLVVVFLLARVVSAHFGECFLGSLDQHCLLLQFAVGLALLLSQFLVF